MNSIVTHVICEMVYFQSIHMGMALKTVWIVPRWSGRLERGGYVKGHDPEVSKAPVCGLVRGHMEMSSKVDGLWTKSLKQGKKPNNHKF